MLVGAGEEESGGPLHAVPAGQRVGDERRVEVADMGAPIDVEDGRRHHDWLLTRHTRTQRPQPQSMLRTTAASRGNL